jgi:hypothetical protein
MHFIFSPVKNTLPLRLSKPHVHTFIFGTGLYNYNCWRRNTHLFSFFLSFLRFFYLLSFFNLFFLIFWCELYPDGYIAGIQSFENLPSKFVLNTQS